MTKPIEPFVYGSGGGELSVKESKEEVPAQSKVTEPVVTPSVAEAPARQETVMLSSPDQLQQKKIEAKLDAINAAMLKKFKELSDFLYYARK